MMLEQKTLILKKHINTIHCSNQFTLVQRKLFNGLLFNAYNHLNDESRQYFTISAKDLCKLIGYNSNDYESLREDLMVLMSTVISWDVINPKFKSNKTILDEIKVIHVHSQDAIASEIQNWKNHHVEGNILLIRHHSSWSAYRILDIEKNLENKAIKPSSVFDNFLNSIEHTAPLSLDMVEEIIQRIEKNKLFEKQKWGACPALGGVVFDKGICTYEYSGIMRELLYHPELYGRIEMSVQAKFKSIYGLVLYENCIRYQSLPYTSWLTVNQFRLMMGLSPEIYPIFRDLKKRVIDKGVDEVNYHSSLDIEVELRKIGRVVTEIRFKLAKKHQNKALTLKKETPDLENKLQEYGIPRSKIVLWMNDYSQEYVLEKIQTIENSTAFKCGKIRNLAALLEKAIVEDYKPPKSSKKLLNEKSHKEDLNELVEKRKENALKEKYRTYKNSEMLNIFNKMLEPDKLDILKDFEIYTRMNSPHVYKNYLISNKNILTVNVTPYFISYLSQDQNHYKHIFDQTIINYEEFSKLE